MKTVTIYTDGGLCGAKSGDVAPAPGFAGTAGDDNAGPAGRRAE